MPSQDVKAKTNALIKLISEYDVEKNLVYTVNITTAQYNSIFHRMMRKMKRKWREERRCADMSKQKFMGNLGVMK